MLLELFKKAKIKQSQIENCIHNLFLKNILVQLGFPVWVIYQNQMSLTIKQLLNSEHFEIVSVVCDISFVLCLYFG